MNTQDTWPLQPNLSVSEKQLYQIATSNSGRDSFVLSSPDGRYLAYASITTHSSGFSVAAIADTQSQSIIITSEPAVGAFAGPDDFMVYWSPDQQSFVLEYARAQGNTPLFYFFSGYDFATGTATSQRIATEINGEGRFAMEVYDVASDNESVLIDTLPSGLVLWNYLSPSTPLVIQSGGVKDAMFAPNDDNIVYAIAGDGLVQYNLATGSRAILRSDLNASWIRRAEFSPDGTHIALVEGLDNGLDNLYVVDISNETQISTQSIAALTLVNATTDQDIRTLTNNDTTFHEREYERLLAVLESARDESHLPDEPSCKPALNDLLLRVRGVR